MNNVVLIGRLVKDPELRYLANTGTAITRFMLAIDKELNKDKKVEYEKEGKPSADFISIVAWGKVAEVSANYLVKGQMTGIQGRIQSRSWENEKGERRYVTEVVAERVEFLEWKERENFNIEGFYEVSNEDVPF